LCASSIKIQNKVETHDKLVLTKSSRKNNQNRKNEKSGPVQLCNVHKKQQKKNKKQKIPQKSKNPQNSKNPQKSKTTKNYQRIFHSTKKVLNSSLPRKTKNRKKTIQENGK
jgi:hypothetical protein